MNATIIMLLMQYGSGAIEPVELANEIIVVSERYNVDPELVTRIIIVESRANPKAYNSASQDTGLMQINKVHQVPQVCLNDWRCNLAKGVALLAHMKRSKNFRPCHYNTGAAGSRKYPKQCLQYETKIANL